jgi:hypothetical protein
MQMLANQLVQHVAEVGAQWVAAGFSTLSDMLQ